MKAALGIRGALTNAQCDTFGRHWVTLATAREQVDAFTRSQTRPRRLRKVTRKRLKARSSDLAGANTNANDESIMQSSSTTLRCRAHVHPPLYSALIASF